MAKKLKDGKPPKAFASGRPSALLDTRPVFSTVYCGDTLEPLAKPALEPVEQAPRPLC